MVDLFGIDIAGLLADNMADGMPEATLTKRAPTGRTAGSLSAGNAPVSTAYSCRGIVSDYSEFEMAQGGELSTIRRGDRKVLLLAATLAAVPQQDDLVTILGGTYRIVSVKSDPAEATWTCQCRR